ncbi:hypothetical protein BC831DRAFT_459888 [Entophlyctis helioformis]|nr:hypothetical protein BC831DRAFT_459888 [Entophlyctis helioformis]
MQGMPAMPAILQPPSALRPPPSRKSRTTRAANTRIWHLQQCESVIGWRRSMDGGRQARRQACRQARRQARRHHKQHTPNTAVSGLGFVVTDLGQPSSNNKHAQASIHRKAQRTKSPRRHACRQRKHSPRTCPRRSTKTPVCPPSTHPAPGQTKTQHRSNACGRVFFERLRMADLASTLSWGVQMGSATLVRQIYDIWLSWVARGCVRVGACGCV